MTENQIDTFTRLTQDSSSFWEKYSRGRPSVPASFWRRLTEFHAQYGNGRFIHIHDLGSGPGIHAPALGEHFSLVTLTDPNPKNIEVATAVLSQLPDGKRYTCQVGRGEDAIKSEDLEKYDMVFMGNSLHWMEIEVSLKNVASSLRDGGSVVAALFGVPDVTNPYAMNAIREWLKYGVDENVDRNISLTFGNSIKVQDSDYDTVNMDPFLWENITRIRLNRDTSGSRGFMTDKILQTYNVDGSKVTQAEKVVHEDDIDWYVNTDMSGLHEMMATFPVPTTPVVDKKLWDSLSSVYDAEPVEIHYGVSIILATKRPKK